MKCKCKLCRHEWESRKDNPRSCPRCKRYDWKAAKEEQEK